MAVEGGNGCVLLGVEGGGLANGGLGGRGKRRLGVHAEEWGRPN